MRKLLGRDDHGLGRSAVVQKRLKSRHPLRAPLSIVASPHLPRGPPFAAWIWAQAHLPWDCPR